MILPHHIIPIQDTIRREENIEGRFRILFNKGTDVRIQILLHAFNVSISRCLFRYLFRLLIIMHHPLYVVVFVRPPALIYRSQVRLIRVCKRTHNIVQEHILIPQILCIIPDRVIIEILRDRILGLFNTACISHHIHTQKNSLYLVVTGENTLHNVRLILRICSTVIQFNGIHVHQLFKPVGIKIHRHGGTQNHTVIFHVLSHARILTQLIVYQIWEILKRCMILEERIDPDYHCRLSEQTHYHCTDCGKQPLLIFVHTKTYLTSEIQFIFLCKLIIQKHNESFNHY